MFCLRCPSWLNPAPAPTVDYEAIAGKAFREMNAQDVQRFFVVCALVYDLYCPGFNPRESLAKDSNLARTAARYKINPAKITADVRTELAKNAKKKRGAERNQDANESELGFAGPRSRARPSPRPPRTRDGCGP